MLKFLLLLALSPLVLTEAHGAITLPRDLSESHREAVLRILGAGTSAKLLADPYPLGGYPGIELGYSVERVPMQDLEGLGSGTDLQSDTSFSKLSLGKGVYNDIDLFIEFMPYGITPEFSSFGASLRWLAYQAPEIPFSLTTVVHANSSNFSNKLITQSFATELFGTVHVDRFSLFGGLGYLQVEGRFIGGVSGLTDSGDMEKNIVNMGHNFFGISYRLGKTFAAVQIDRYQRSVISAKIGLRF